MILSPMAMTASFAAFTRPDAAVYLPGAPFLLAAGLMLLALFIFMLRPSRADVASSAA